MSTRFKVSERKACRIMRLSRSTARYQGRPRASDEFATALRALANQHLGVGYRQLYKRMRRAGWLINHKRVYRIYREMALQQRRKKPVARIHGDRKTHKPTKVNEMWAMDFMADRLTGGPSYRLFAAIDCCSRECLTIDANGSMTGTRVVRVLNEIATVRGLPRIIVSDNGPEFRSRVVQAWAAKNGVELHYIDPGRPTQNPFIESFNSLLRAECLELRDVDTLREARRILQDWQHDYNEERPHGSLNDATPNEAASTLERTPFRAATDSHILQNQNNSSLTEKRKTQAFPSFPQALPPRNQLRVP